MRRTASARSIAEARADNTAGRSSIRRTVGDGTVNLADVWPTITRGVQNPKQEEGWRVQVAPPGNMRAAPPGGVRVAPPERVRVAPPGSVRAAPPGRVRVALLKRDRPVVCVLEVHYDGGVSRYQA